MAQRFVLDEEAFANDFMDAAPNLREGRLTMRMNAVSSLSEATSLR